MEQIRQILKQLALHLELNIAMCDMLDDHEKRIKSLETSRDAQKTRIDGLNSSLTNLAQLVSNPAYEARRASMTQSKK